MIAKTFKMRMSPDVKKILSTLAQRERRSRANLITTLILEKYEAVKIAEKPTQTNRKELSLA